MTDTLSKVVHTNPNKASKAMRKRERFGVTFWIATSFVGIPGMVPSPLARPTGCQFAPRCRDVQPGCTILPAPRGRSRAGVDVRCVQYA